MIPGYTFDLSAQRYREATTGRFVPERAMVEAMIDVVEAQQRMMADLAIQLQAQSISLARWQMGMVEAIKTAHTVSAGLAVGGWGRLDRQTVERAERLIDRQLAYLARFAVQIQTGRQPLNGLFEQRVRMYAAAAHATVQELRRDQAEQASYDEERRVLGIADHCEDCLDASHTGWAPIHTLPPIGESACRTNCHCHFEFRRRAESA